MFQEFNLKLIVDKNYNLRDIISLIHKQTDKCIMVMDELFEKEETINKIKIFDTKDKLIEYLSTDKCLTYIKHHQKWFKAGFFGTDYVIFNFQIFDDKETKIEFSLFNIDKNDKCLTDFIINFNITMCDSEDDAWEFGYNACHSYN